jgi:ABC-type uncharacterized transport system ATPase subunit
MNDAITLKRVNKTFGATKAVSDLDLVVPRGATILFSTHVMPHAEELCDHVIMIRTLANCRCWDTVRARRQKTASDTCRKSAAYRKMRRPLRLHGV